MEKDILYNLQDLIAVFDNWDKIQVISEELTGSKAQLVDSKGRIASGQRELPAFCRLIQSSKLGERLCCQSYTKNCFSEEALKEGSFLFKCHAGLTNFGVPLVLQEGPIGAIVAGRILQIGEEPDPVEAEKYALEIGLRPDLYLEHLQALRKISPEQLQSFQRLVKPFAQPIGETISRYGHLLGKAESLLTTARQWYDLLMIDELTGLYNRRFLSDRLAEEIHRFKRYRRPFSIIMIEMDGFKKINDTYGHQAGDIVLKELADLFRKSARKSEVIARYGGDEFVIISPESDELHTYQFAERLRKEVAEHEFATEANLSIYFTLSMGVAAYTEDISAEELISRVDKALYRAKYEGKNKVIRYSSLVEEIPKEIPVEIPHITIPPPSEPRRRVVITGLGVISPIGIGKEAFWQALKAGKSGYDRITKFDPNGLRCQIAGEVNGFDPTKYMNPREVRRTDRFAHFAIAAAKMAVEDAQLEMERENRERIGTCIGTALGGMEFGAEQHTLLLKDGPRRVSPYLAIAFYFGSCSSQISQELGLKGPSVTLSTGSVAGADAIGYALRSIRDNETDMMVAGGADSCLMPLTIEAFAVIGALSTRNHDPRRAMKPFDLERDGFILSEGAGVVVLEEMEHALRRGAHIYAELTGFGETCDAYHITRPDPDGLQAARAIVIALKDAGIKPEQVDYINAHGTATPLNDAVETKVIKEVFGSHAYKLPVSSTKSMTGHSQGAASAMELVACALALENNFIPPTINYEHPDPLCDLDYVPNVGREAKLDVILSNSFGFGGKNAALIIKRFV